MERRDKTNYYLDIAETVAKRGTCIRRKFGCIIVNNDEIISTGYAGAPRGRKNCSDMEDGCMRDKLGIPRGERYEMCRSVHAEANAIISASRSEMLGATLYMVCVAPETGEPVGGTDSCAMCKRLIINAGISKVVVRDTADNYRAILVEDWIENDETLEGSFGY